VAGSPVVPICRVLTQHGVSIAPSGYYAARHRSPSARAVRDERVRAEIERVFHDRDVGRGLYGARKVWAQLAREGGIDGAPVPRCQVERLMRTAGLRGAGSGTVFTAVVSDVYSRRIVGWRTATRMPTQLPLDALEMALWTRDRAGHGLRLYSPTRPCAVTMKPTAC
jgi:putative transposase